MTKVTLVVRGQFRRYLDETVVDRTYFPESRRILTTYMWGSPPTTVLIAKHQEENKMAAKDSKMQNEDGRERDLEVQRRDSEKVKGGCIVCTPYTRPSKEN